jgi:uncharacterized protein HemX
MLRIALLLILALSTSVSYGQLFKKKKKKHIAAPAQQQQPTTLNPLPQRDYAPKASRQGAKRQTYSAEQRFYERMEQLEKTKRKNEKLSQKPQYSDPSYFGHKRPPKKRKAGKLKYCRECGIRH